MMHQLKHVDQKPFRQLCKVLCKVSFIAIGCWLLTHAPAYARNDAVSTNELRAAYLYQFTKFVQWPDSNSTEVRIGLFGTDPIIEPLLELQGQRARGKHIVIKQISSLESAKECCELLYISQSENKRLPILLEALSTSPTLTVNDADTFLALGGMVSFVLIGSRLRFRLNNKVVEDKGLKLSAELLKVSLSHE